jgi:hypothetical protein
MQEINTNPDDTLVHYADGPAQLETALVGLTDPDLDKAQSASTWTIRQIVHHLVDGDDLWNVCIKAALGNSEGLFTLQWYWDKPQTEWAENWGYANRPIEPSLALFRANRFHIVELIRQTPEAWEKSIRIKWPRREEMRISIGYVLGMQANHVGEHIREILTIRHMHNL